MRQIIVCDNTIHIWPAERFDIRIAFVAFVGDNKIVSKPTNLESLESIKFDEEDFIDIPLLGGRERKEEAKEIEKYVQKSIQIKNGKVLYNIIERNYNDLRLKGVSQKYFTDDIEASRYVNELREKTKNYIVYKLAKRF